MSILSAQADELRTLSNELRQLAKYRGLEQEERILCVASADAMNDAAETIDSLRNEIKISINSPTTVTRYEALFGSPGKMAAYIVAKCGFDCPACPMPWSCPGREDCGLFSDQENFDKVLAWLNESYKCGLLQAGDNE